MAPEDDESLPDAIYTHDHAAEVARALGDHFEKREDRTLKRMANAIASVMEARDDYEGDRGRYGSRVTFIDSDGDAHTAIVMEPEVGAISEPKAWDPYREEMVDPREAYPLGTVQLIYTPGFDLSDGFNFDRKSDLEVMTSVPPARTPEETHCYYPGWDFALEN